MDISVEYTATFETKLGPVQIQGPEKALSRITMHLEEIGYGYDSSIEAWVEGLPSKSLA